MVSANSLAMWKKPRPPTQQQCLVCGKSGHCVESCSDVTGVAIERGRADRGDRGDDDDGGGGKRRRPRSGKKKGACFDHNKRNGGKCTRGEKCKFKHECANCGASDHIETSEGVCKNKKKKPKPSSSSDDDDD